jgi:hypothetical protein
MLMLFVRCLLPVKKCPVVEDIPVTCILIYLPFMSELDG